MHRLYEMTPRNMTVVLHDNTDAATDAARECEKDIRNAFKGAVEVTTMPADAPTSWPGDESWDDLLIVVYANSKFPDAGNQFVSDFVSKKKSKLFILPVSVDSHHRKPPGPAQRFKAFEIKSDSFGTNGRLTNRIGAILGLRVQKRDGKIFISYRASDGAAIAKQLYDVLTAVGFNVWLDEARELDGDTMILPGSDVQKEIDQALGDANFLLLLDTDGAPHSPWIKHEVDTANGIMLPILPLCFRDERDPKIGPRFRSLLELQRWVPFRTPAPGADPPLNADEVTTIIGEMENYMCEIFQRRCRVPFIVEREFVSRAFAWKALDQRLLMFESLKQHSSRLSTRVISHCSVFDQIYSPALKSFAEFLAKTGRSNYSLFIYDGPLIPEPQLDEIVKEAAPPSIILHHQELATLIESNFTKLK